MKKTILITGASRGIGKACLCQPQIMENTQTAT
jgi:short-subunit dehydrogenase